MSAAVRQFFLVFVLSMHRALVPGLLLAALGCHNPMTALSVSEDSIDLTKLIGMTDSEALAQLVDWGIVVSSTPEDSAIYAGYDGGLQIQMENGNVEVIWVNFTARNGEGAFPYRVNAVLTPLAEVEVLRNAFGEPSSSSDDYAWVKWIKSQCQIHCEYADSMVVMVTLMKPDWQPGK